MAKDLLLEIGSEELPASFVRPALDDLARVFTERAAAARLAHGRIRTYGTPRRLGLSVEQVSERTPDLVRDVQGPSVKAPAQAVEKFAQGLGLTPGDLAKVTTPKGEYWTAKVEEKGRSAPEILKDVLHAAVHGIAFKKSMRWGDVELAFARPVHWIVALFGEEVLPVIFGDVRSGRTTYGHRFLAPQGIELRSPAEYEARLEKAHVVPDLAKRRGLVAERVRSAADRAGAKVLEDEALLEQVTNLVELPCPVVGSFDERHLDLPPEVLVQEMKSHQRYFSLCDAAGKLIPRFVAVSNTPVKDERLSLRGYERVLRARLSDGRFFFDEDRRIPLVDRVPKLHRVVWQGKLGSYAEKVDRFRALAVFLAERTGQAGHRGTIERAATLAKADLVTGMVGEFPELQGVMGREYALASGEPPEVARAIFEHYLPRGSADALPTDHAGALIGMADRLDSLCGIFGIGKSPTGAADPFGLRRACLGIINVTLAKGYRFSLGGAIDESLRLLGPKIAGVTRKPTEPAVKDEVLEFFRGRLKALWSDGHRADIVEAVLRVSFDDLCAARLRLEALSAVVGRTDFAPLATTFKRVGNIVQKQAKDVAKGPCEAQRLVEAAEQALHAALLEVRARVRRAVGADDYASALKEMTTLKPAVDLFFEKVMVMAEDRSLRENRVRLLVEIAELFEAVADFGEVHPEAS